MAGNLFNMPRVIAFDLGEPQAGAKLNFYQTGTSTPQNTYQDLALTTPHANPVVADGEGIFDPIYFDPALPDYRMHYTDSADVEIWPAIDDIPAGSAGKTISLEHTEPYVEFVETDAAANNQVYRIGVNSEQFLLQLGNDAKDTFVDILTLDRSANTADSLALVTTALTNNGNNLAEITKGSFTPTFTGFSADPSTPTVRWTKIGTTVHVLLAFGTGTSNGTGFTITNWPAAIQTDTSVQVPVGGLVDNGSEITGGCISLTNASATATFYTDFGFGTWTGSSTKGVNNTSLSTAFSYSTDYV